ncbi:MAG: ComF family protein [Gammaproteobacteria bacterium]|nr:ComF family protein [Gammaproteobacteria bacterium]
MSHLLPKHCLFCLEKTQSHFDLCDHCIKSLTLNNHCCQRCASPLEASLFIARERNITLCGNCLSHHYHYDRVYSPFVYSEEMRYLIKKLKYQKKIHFAQALAKLFLQKIHDTNDFQLPQTIIPMPMHPKRLRQRGFNQALELSRFFASHYKLPLNYTSLIRSRYTDLQAGMNAIERQKNVQKAFLVKKPINYEHIALIDDVMTTGSTVNEAAKILKQSGIKKVDIWIIARAGLEN